MSYTRANIGDLPIDYSTLVTPADVAAHLGDADWRAIDCRHDLADPAAGERRYREEHLPGAQFAHLDRDLSGPRTATSGRHPLPDAEAFAAACSRWGIDADVQVVAYDDAGGAYAARLWWLLRAYGHRRVAVLDGGLAAWRRAGLPLETSIVTPPPRTFGARAFAGRTVDVAAVARIALDPATLLLDARAAERYAGSVEPVDPVAGHVPGAINRPFQQNLGADGRFLPAAELERQFTALLADRPAERLVSMCGSGVTACHTLLALEVAGLRGAVLYPGSWSEWCRQPDRPVATGATP